MGSAIPTAAEYLNAGKAIEALELLEQGQHPPDPPDPVDLYGKAIALARLDRAPDAIAVLKELLAIAPHHAKANQLLSALTASPTPAMPSSNPVVLQTSANFYGSVLLNPTTLANLATAPETWQRILAFHQQLATDEYVAYLDGYYRECVDRFGAHWHYLDIVNVLFAAAQVLQPKHYLEIGVRRGRSVCVVARACPTVNVFAFDLWMPDYAGMENPGPEFVALELKKHGHQGTVSFIDGDSHVTVPQFFGEHPGLELDLITVDGDHSEAGALDDLCNVVPHLAIGGILVFDDIAHPEHPYLLNVWRTVLAQFPYLSGFEYSECGYGIGFAIRTAA